MTLSQELIESFYCSSTEHPISLGHCDRCKTHCEACCEIDECSCCGEEVYEHSRIKPKPKSYFCIKCNMKVPSYHFAGTHGYSSEGAIKMGIARVELQ